MKIYKQELSQLIADISDAEKVIKLEEYLVSLQKKEEAGTYKAAIAAIQLLGNCNHESATFVLLAIASNSYELVRYEQGKCSFNFGNTARKAAIKALSKTSFNKSLVTEMLIKDFYYPHINYGDILKTLSKICTREDISSLSELCSWSMTRIGYKQYHMIPRIIDLMKLLWEKS